MKIKVIQGGEGDEMLGCLRETWGKNCLIGSFLNCCYQAVNVLYT